MRNAGSTITGRCYCGAVSFVCDTVPLTVAYCHCSDCRRWTGAPVAAFAAFSKDALHTTPELDRGTSHAPGVTRWNCAACGSPLAAQFAYLPDQVYVPTGLLDQAANFPPQIHCHEDARYPWLHISDDLKRTGQSARDQLNEAG